MVILLFFKNIFLLFITIEVLYIYYKNDQIVKEEYIITQNVSTITYGSVLVDYGIFPSAVFFFTPPYPLFHLKGLYLCML